MQPLLGFKLVASNLPLFFAIGEKIGDCASAGQAIYWTQSHVDFLLEVSPRLRPVLVLQEPKSIFLKIRVAHGRAHLHVIGWVSETWLSPS